MTHRWQLAPPQPALAATLARSLKLSPLLAQCLLNRGLSTPGEIQPFLEPRLRHLADPFALPDMERAVERLYHAREREEAMVIFGDYDVDGVTSTALLLEVLRALGWRVHAYLPNRMDEGYGLSREGVENCLERHPVSLLLAVDCGSTAVETIGWLRERGVDAIVLDHHQVSQPPPAAVALVNPQRGTAFQELCSAGLAFKLAHALVKRGRERGDAGAATFDLKPLLDLVALGTVADLVPLRGENRIFVAQGLPRLGETPRPGLQALKEVAGCGERIGVYEVGFQLGPRLNAAGRLESAEESLRLLLAESAAEATPIAQSLDARNRERQEIEHGIAAEVLGAVRATFDAQRDYAIVEGQLLWHIGVVGIVASRVVREFYRPAFVLGGDGAIWRGSGRSIAGFDLAAALRECDDLLETHGGHAMAAGLSVRPENVAALRERLNRIARRTLKPEDLIPPIALDAEVGLGELNLAALEELDRLQPFGQANPAVHLAVRGVRLASEGRIFGRQNQHLRFRVRDAGPPVDAIWWNGAQRQLPAGLFDVACVPEINDYNGRRSVRLKVLDVRAA